MANQVVFAKWNNDPDGLYQSTFVTTKYYDLGTSSNKVVFLKFVVNLIMEASSHAFITVFYRTDTISDFVLFAAKRPDFSSSNSGKVISLIKYGAQGIPAFVNDVPGIQFKIKLVAQNDVAINDFHFLYRKKRKYGVEETD